jgi:hypothetical protein
MTLQTLASAVGVGDQVEDRPKQVSNVDDSAREAASVH